MSSRDSLPTDNRGGHCSRSMFLYLSIVMHSYFKTNPTLASRATSATASVCLGSVWFILPNSYFMIQKYVVSSAQYWTIPAMCAGCHLHLPVKCIPRVIEYHALRWTSMVTWVSAGEEHWCLLWMTELSETESQLLVVNSTCVQLQEKMSDWRHLSARKGLDTSGHDLIFCYVTVGLAQGSQL